MTAEQPPVAYQPMTLVELAGHLASADDDRHRWRLIAEFLTEYQHEPAPERVVLLAHEPPGTGDERWDVFLAALAEHLATQDGQPTAGWESNRHWLAIPWFPFNSPAARFDAWLHAPASFRNRGIFVAPQELGVGEAPPAHRQPLPAPHAKEDYATRMLSAAWRETVDLYLPDTPKDP